MNENDGKLFVTLPGVVALKQIMENEQEQYTNDDVLSLLLYLFW